MTLIAEEGEKIYDYFGNLFATINKDIYVGDNVSSNTFTFHDGHLREPGDSIENEIIDYFEEKKGHPII